MEEFEIIWTPRAEEEFAFNLEYLEENWSYKVILKYLDRVEVVLKNISKNPTMYVCVDKKREIHKCVLNKQITLYYRIESKTIELITFFGTRQDPEKLKLQ